MELLRLYRKNFAFPAECLICARPASDLALPIARGLRGPICRSCAHDRIAAREAGVAAVASLALATAMPLLSRVLPHCCDVALAGLLAVSLLATLIWSALWYSWRPLPWQRRIQVVRANGWRLILAIDDPRLASAMQQSTTLGYRAIPTPIVRRPRNRWSRLRLWLASL